MRGGGNTRTGRVRRKRSEPRVERQPKCDEGPASHDRCKEELLEDMCQKEFDPAAFIERFDAFCAMDVRECVTQGDDEEVDQEIHFLGAFSENFFLSRLH